MNVEWDAVWALCDMLYRLPINTDTTLRGLPPNDAHDSPTLIYMDQKII
jgi:hypothetical protein